MSMGADYAIYIEDYVLSYLKREVDSLELSEIFFYGKRENGGRKFLVYGAGRRKEIAAFADYALLDELVCRLTQAGPVFMVREKNGDYKTSGFQTFYANNEAMQNYLIEWTGMEGGRRPAAEPGGGHKESVSREIVTAYRSSGGEKKGRTGSVMSVQLCLILVVLVAIVISSTNSYRKMERLNQSAKEVFFAIENQEAEDSLTDDAGQQEKRTEVLVERDTGTDDISVEEAVRAENAAQTDETDREDAAQGNGTDREDTAQADETDQEDVSQENETGQEDAAQGNGTDREDTAQADETDQEDAARTEETGQEDAARVDETGQEDAAQAEESQGEASEEALSRNITRYYEVERGDTLYTISQKIYGDTSRVERICEINAISDPDRISEGQKIILP